MYPYHEKKILIIDDDPVNRRMVKSRLEKTGFQCVEASDGDVGLEKVKKENPDLIILDVEMPRMNGYTFMLMLKTLGAYASIPVIVLTAHPNKQPIFQLRGVKGYLVKPLDFHALIDRIHNSLFRVEKHFPQMVFIVEQNPTQRKLIAHFIGKGGFSNLSFYTVSDEALQKLSEMRPSLIVADGTEANFDPIDFCSRVKDISANTSTIVILGKDKESIRQEVSMSPFIDFVCPRSPNYAELLEKMEMIVEATEISSNNKEE